MSLTPEEKQFWEALKSPYYVSEINDNADLARAIMHGKTTGVTLDCLAAYIVKIAERMAKKKNFVSFTYCEDMVADAVMQMLQSYPSFDEKKSDNPFAYLTTVCHSAFIQRINREKKQIEIIKNLKEELKL